MRACNLNDPLSKLNYLFTERNIVHLCTAICVISLSYFNAHSQKIDSTKYNGKGENKTFWQFIGNAITKKAVDTAIRQDVLISKNDESFQVHNGKFIRRIHIQEFGFEKTFTDTAKEVGYPGKSFVKRLHSNTKEWVIRNNLFIKEKTVFRANLVADNERYLRSLDYIHDARILVKPVGDEPDSVDLVVITKDFLSITFHLNSASSKRFKSRFGDVNIAGTAQNVQFTTLLEKDRTPHFGYEVFYRNNNIANTFLTTTISYSQITNDLHDGTSSERMWRAEVERPLVSQYLRVAGGMMFARGQTNNYYSRPDSIFYNYGYNSFDVWSGLNLGVRKFLFLKSVLNRQFVSLRYFRNEFTEVPSQIGEKFNFKLNDRQALLAQFTFFKQDFYKTNYVFGFGITEDVPYGYNIALTGGWYKQLHLERGYVGADANWYVISKGGKVIQYFLRNGAFLHKGKFQDAVVLLGASSFSRVYNYKNLKMRLYLRLSYTKQFNRIGLDPLGINNVFGLPYISLDSAGGNQRANLHTETIFFIGYKLLGFKFALFPSADMVFFTPEKKKISDAGFFSGFGGGMRARNENIQFNTIELRFMYFPRKSLQHNSFKVTLTTDLRFRYSSSYVKAPDIIHVNSDYNRNIY